MGQDPITQGLECLISKLVVHRRLAKDPEDQLHLEHLLEKADALLKFHNEEKEKVNERTDRDDEPLVVAA